MDPEKEYTEAELTGEDVPEAPAGETPGEPAAPTEPKPVDPEPAPAPAEPVVPAEPAVPGKPEEPPGAGAEPAKMVPLAALQEERAVMRGLRDRIQTLESQIATPPKDPDELIAEDPEEAIRYAYQKIEDLETKIARREMETQIKTEVPDFFDKAPRMEEYLLGQGFSEEAIVRMIGASGEDAPKFFGILSKLVEQPDSTKLREELVAELTPRIRDEESKRIMEKFKIIEPGTNIGNLPGSPGDGKLAISTEDEFAKLTPEMQEKWLSGQV